MGIRKNMVTAKLRLDILRAMVEDGFKGLAKIKYAGRKFKVIVETEYNNGTKITVEYESDSIMPLLTVSDDLFEGKAEIFVAHLVHETRSKVKEEVACKVLDEYFWHW